MTHTRRGICPAPSTLTDSQTGKLKTPGGPVSGLSQGVAPVASGACLGEALPPTPVPARGGELNPAGCWGRLWQLWSVQLPSRPWTVPPGPGVQASLSGISEDGLGAEQPTVAFVSPRGALAGGPQWEAKAQKAEKRLFKQRCPLVWAGLRDWQVGSWTAFPQLTELTDPAVRLGSHPRGCVPEGKGRGFPRAVGSGPVCPVRGEQKLRRGAGRGGFVLPDVWLRACGSLSNRYTNAP